MTREEVLFQSFLHTWNFKVTAICLIILFVGGCIGLVRRYDSQRLRNAQLAAAFYLPILFLFSALKFHTVFAGILAPLLVIILVTALSRITGFSRRKAVVSRILSFIQVFVVFLFSIAYKPVLTMTVATP